MKEPIIDRLSAGTNTVTTKAVEVGGDRMTFAALNGGTFAAGVGISAAVGLIVSQLEYRAKKRDMRNIMREELAVSQGKAIDQVTNDDVDRLSDINGVVKQQLDKTKKERNISVGTIFTATLATAAILTVATGGFGILATPVLTLSGLSPAVAIGIKILASIAIYGAIKKPLTMIAEKAFGIEEKTTFDRIESIQRDRMDDRKITKERVMSVFVSANPDLERYIVATYGKKFDALKVADKDTIIQTIGEKLGVTTLTNAINKNQIRAMELAFTVEGKASGVLPTAGEKPKHTVLMTIKERLHQVTDHFPGHHHEQEKPQRSFVERYARVPAEKVGQVQRLNEARAAEATAITQR